MTHARSGPTLGQTRALLERSTEVARSLRGAVATPARPHGRPSVVILMGYPGSGKTHCARLLAARLGAAHVASDHLRAELFVAPSYAPEENAAVFRLVGSLVGELLGEGHRVIVDATHLREAQRAGVLEIAEKAAVPARCVFVEADERDILARLDARAGERASHDRSDADRDVYEMMRERGFEPPATYLVLRNGPDLEREIARVARELEDAWSAAM